MNTSLVLLGVVLSASVFGWAIFWHKTIKSRKLHRLKMWSLKLKRTQAGRDHVRKALALQQADEDLKKSTLSAIQQVTSRHPN